MRRWTPLGFFDELLPTDGISPYAGGNTPGPLGTVTDQVSTWPTALGTAAAIEAALRAAGVPFAVDTETYWLRRRDAEWRLSSNEVAVPLPEAQSIIGRAAEQYRGNVPLVRLFETAALQLTGTQQDWTFVLVREPVIQ